MISGFEFIFNIILEVNSLPREKEVFMRSRILLINHLENSPGNESLISLTLLSGEMFSIRLISVRFHPNKTPPLFSISPAPSGKHVAVSDSLILVSSPVVRSTSIMSISSLWSMN